jgi:imidazolonepropionase-like amidohydrolase
MSYWLRSANVWRDPPAAFAPGVVVVEDGSIAAVLPPDAAPVPGDSMCDVGSAFLLPGLINTHVHLEFSASPLPLREYESETPEERLLRAAGNAHRLLMSGVTTARDCGSGWSMLALARRPELSPVRLPRLICCGPPLTPPRGHLHVMGGEMSSLDDIDRHIDQAVRLGARSVKAMASGGGMTPGTRPEEPTFPLDTLRAIVVRARGRALPSVAHVLATESIRRAALAGFDSLEHCAFFNRNSAGLLVRVYDDTVAQTVADSGTFVMANLSTATRPLNAMRAASTQDPAGRHQLEQFDRMVENFGRLVGLGIPIVCGTDAGVRDTPFEDTWREIDWLVRAGLAPADAIRAATTHAARALGLDGTVGRIAPGHAADLIATDRNPLHHPAALDHPLFLMARGEVLRGLPDSRRS